MRLIPYLALSLLIPFAWGNIQPAFALTAQDINRATLVPAIAPDGRGPDPLIVKAQTLLARRNISPGVIDGLDGENYRKAIAQFRRQVGLPKGESVDEETWLALSGDDLTDIVTEHTITEGDASYEFSDEIPKDYAAQAKMKRLGYTGPVERLAERFHMGEGLLKLLNPSVDYRKAGETISVVAVRRVAPAGPVERIEADKRTGMVVVYGTGDQILASYPASIGSEQTPSPQGEHTVERIAKNPTYHYDPEKNFQQGSNTEKLVLPPGPNNPVGTVWIALSKPTFGIHGTPEPSRVSKTNSNGCVRLTNWDAEELAGIIKPGVPVRFVEADRP